MAPRPIPLAAPHRHGTAGDAGDCGTGWLDRGAIGLSGLCLVHCLALPAIVALLPAARAMVPRESWVHPVILAAALPLAGVALWRGWRRHRDRRPALLGALGLTLMITGLASSESGIMETILTVIGGLTLASAHALNWRIDHDARFHADGSVAGKQVRRGPPLEPAVHPTRAGGGSSG